MKSWSILFKLIINLFPRYAYFHVIYFYKIRKKLQLVALENNLKVLEITFQLDNYSSSMIDKQFHVISQWTMGESLSMQISIDRYTIRCEVFIEKPIQRGLQCWAETRNCFAVALLAIASRHSTARRLRDAQRNYPRHGIVSTSMKRRV